MPTALYLDTSAVLRPLLEDGKNADSAQQIAAADILLTSRLTIVEAARVMLRLRLTGAIAPARLADVSYDLDALWGRCEIWELTPAVCDLAATVAPSKALRALDALHLATYLLARRRLGAVQLLTADERLREAADAT